MLATPQQTMNLQRLPEHVVDLILKHYDTNETQFEPLFHIPREIYVSHVDQRYAEYIAYSRGLRLFGKREELAYKVFEAATVPTMRYLGISPFNMPVAIIVNAPQPMLANYLWTYFTREPSVKDFRTRRSFTVALTLMRLLHMFNPRWDTVRSMTPLRWHISVTLPNVSMAEMVLRSHCTISDVELMVSLAGLLLLEPKRGRKVTQYWRTGDHTYLLTSTPNPSQRQPCRMIVNIWMHATRHQVNLLLDCLRRSESEVKLPVDVFDPRFRIYLEVKSRNNDKLTMASQHFHVVKEFRKK